ncbi:phage tail spike protein [Macrococcoides bohemicum]|uniref:phage tail spike protein n=1 Tax=Macrococcoides bohemicum TaxID=1903056 RepID=UPI00289A99ED|nr:phage tail spike protein [Macrococcus bohemicus]
MIYLFNVKKELNKIIPRTNLISFIQELEINGLYLSEVELPLFYKTEYGQYYNHKKSFDSASFFGFFDTKKKFQLYKIHTRKVDGRLLIVSGVHLFFDEAKAMSVVRDKRLIDVDAAGATNTVFNGTGWTVKSSDVTPLKSIDFYYQTPQEARSRIIESWNIEFDYDLTFDGKKITSKNIYIKKKLGVWTGDRYSYGTNILSIVQEQDEAEVFTAAIGRGASDDTNTALNAKVLFDDLSWSKDGYTKPLGQDYIEIPSATAQYGYYDSNGNVKPRIAVIDFDDIQDQKILADKTYEWLKQNCVPKVSYQTTVAKAGDYYLGDEIGIIYKDIDIVKKARVEKIKVNMLNPKLSELGLGDYQFFKQDRFKKNIRNEISTVKKDTLTGIQKIRQEFSDQFDVTKQEWEAQIQQVEINATAQVQAAETRMNEQLTSAKNELDGQISDGYTKAVTDAETKAKALDATITQTVTANKQAADKTMGELNTALGSTNSKVGTIEQNVTAAQQNIATLNNTTNAQQTAIQNAQNDIGNLKTTVGGHTASISNLDNQIKLTATKTEVTNAINNIEIGGRNLLKNSKYFAKDRWLTYLESSIETIENENYYNVKITGGTNLIKAFYMVNKLKENYVNEFVTLSIRIKNNGSPLVLGHNWLAKQTDNPLPKDFDGIYHYSGYISSYAAGQIQFRTEKIEDELDFDIYWVKIEKGNKATDWTPAPEDVEEKISKNEASIQVNSDEIIKRVTKTDFDARTGDIEQIANTAKSTADSNTQTITTVKGNVDALTQWKADKGTAIDQTIDSVTNKAWLTDINPITKRVETAEASITTNANEILKRVTKTEFDSTTGRIEGVANTAKSTATSNTAAITTVSGRVGTLEQWRTDKGTAIDQTIDAVTTKVWQNDIDNLVGGSGNIIPDSNNFKKWNWSYGGVQTTIQENVAVPEWNAKDATKFEVAGGSTNNRVFNTIYGTLNKNLTYSIYVKNLSPHRIYLYTNGLYSRETNNNVTIFINSNESKRITIVGYGRDVYDFIQTMIRVEDAYMSAKSTFILWHEMLEYGNMISEWSPSIKDAENRMTEIKQTADGALTKATTIGNDYVKQSAVLVQSDGVLIGSKKVSGAEMASAISVTPSSVDIITKAMRITGDMAVAGDIKTLSLQAVNADIANLRANILTADSVTSTALKVDTALMDKLNVNSILTNKLLADNAMINAIKSNAITAVRGDIAYLKANIITADSITSTALKADLSMIDKLFASSALVNQLTSKTAFIDSINAISVTANSVLINSVKGELGKPNSGLNITRPDGATWIENGVGRNEMVVTGCFPRFTSSSQSAGSPTDGSTVFPIAEWFVTNRTMLGSGYARIDALYFNHDYRYLVLPFAIRVSNVGVYVKVEEFGASTGVTPFSATKLFTTSSHGGGGTQYDGFVIDLGTPTFKRRQFYLYMRPNGEGTDSDLAYARFLPFKLNG